jgi:hypothetical protein
MLTVRDTFCSPHQRILIVTNNFIPLDLLRPYRTMSPLLMSADMVERVSKSRWTFARWSSQHRRLLLQGFGKTLSLRRFQKRASVALS